MGRRSDKCENASSPSPRPRGRRKSKLTVTNIHSPVKNEDAVVSAVLDLLEPGRGAALPEEGESPPEDVALNRKERGRRGGRR